MRDIKLTDDGDIDLTTRDFQFVEGIDCVVQALAIRFQFFLGEWFLDTRLGVPYFQRIFVKGTPTSVVEGILREVVRTTPGVLDLRSFSTSLDKAARSLSVRFSAIMTSGEILDFDRVFVLTSTQTTTV